MLRVLHSNVHQRETNVDGILSSVYRVCFVLIRVEEIDPEAGSDLEVRGGSWWGVREFPGHAQLLLEHCLCPAAYICWREKCGKEHRYRTIFFPIALLSHFTSSLFRSFAVVRLSLLQTPSLVFGFSGSQKSESGCRHCCSYPRAVKNANQGFSHT